jgi:hypothetical protein
VHARFAMLGVAGVLFPEALKGLGLGGPAAQVGGLGVGGGAAAAVLLPLPPGGGGGGGPGLDVLGAGAPGGGGGIMLLFHPS